MSTKPLNISQKRREGFQRIIRCAQPFYGDRLNMGTPPPGVARRQEMTKLIDHHNTIFQHAIVVYNEHCREMGWFRRFWHRNTLASERRSIDAHRSHIRWIRQRHSSYTSPFYKEISE